MHPRLTSLFHRHAATAFDKQSHLADLIGSADWHFDLASGVLSFGDRYAWSAQLLGTESDETGTWLWAWANPSPGLAPALLAAAHALKELGEQCSIEELIRPQLPLREIDGHFLATIASGLGLADAYFRAPYDGGAAFLLVKDEAFPRPDVPPLLRIATLFPQALAALDLGDHKVALTHYLAYHRLTGEAAAETLVVRDDDGQVLTAAFDEYQRLTRLNLTLAGREATDQER
jgi:hypothetical protein